MLLVLFLLAIFAALRGWFPWSVIIFGAAYGMTVTDFGSASYATSLSHFGISMTAGALIEYVVGGTLSAMIVFERF